MFVLIPCICSVDPLFVDWFPDQFVLAQPIEPINVKVMMKALAVTQYEGMKSLRFWHVNFGNLGADFIAEGLPALPMVKNLEIMDCLVGPQGVLELSRHLARLSCTILTHY